MKLLRWSGSHTRSLPSAQLIRGTKTALWHLTDLIVTSKKLNLKSLVELGAPSIQDLKDQ
jgi:hypothetical protein